MLNQLQKAQQYRVTVSANGRQTVYVCKAYDERAARRIVVNFGLCHAHEIQKVNTAKP